MWKWKKNYWWTRSTRKVQQCFQKLMSWKSSFDSTFFFLRNDCEVGFSFVIEVVSCASSQLISIMSVELKMLMGLGSYVIGISMIKRMKRTTRKSIDWSIDRSMPWTLPLIVCTFTDQKSISIEERKEKRKRKAKQNVWTHTPIIKKNDRKAHANNCWWLDQQIDVFVIQYAEKPGRSLSIEKPSWGKVGVMFETKRNKIIQRHIYREREG